jgi:uncharacterized protein YfaT (DUF1175 family)
MPPRAIALAALALAAAAVYAIHPIPVLHATITPTQLWADGYDSATLDISASSRPRITIQGNPHIATATLPEQHGPIWTAEIHAGVFPGVVHIRVEIPGAPRALLVLSTFSSARDAFGDGTPDFLRLDSPADRAAFRRWFTFLAEAQYFQPPQSRPAEIDDCAALIRYAYREALHAHDSVWTSTARLPLVPAFGSPGKYEFPYTPLGAALFRVAPGPYRAADLAPRSGSAVFAQFADAKTLWRYNTHLVSRDLNRAEPGDILFYRQLHGGEPDAYHSMIFLGPSQIHPDGVPYVLYHTGPQNNGPGEMRRLTIDQLRSFPEPEWRPDPENPRFLGIHRWNILKTAQPIQ